MGAALEMGEVIEQGAWGCQEWVPHWGQEEGSLQRGEEPSILGLPVLPMVHPKVTGQATRLFTINGDGGGQGVKIEMIYCPKSRRSGWSPSATERVLFLMRGQLSLLPESSEWRLEWFLSIGPVKWYKSLMIYNPQKFIFPWEKKKTLEPKLHI